MVFYNYKQQLQTQNNRKEDIIYITYSPHK